MAKGLGEPGREPGRGGRMGDMFDFGLGLVKGEWIGWVGMDMGYLSFRCL